MLYDLQYDYMTLVACIFLLVIFLMRQTYKTKSNQILLCLIVVNILGACFDISSCYSISFPERYSMVFNYITTLGYLIFYNSMGILFYFYIDSRAKIESMWKISKIICLSAFIIEFLLIITTPFTHLIVYFDENLKYTHGPLMFLLYAVAAVFLSGSAILFFIARRRFNRYQVFAICSFITCILLCVLIQALYPRALIGQFGCALVMYFLYTALENPVYHTYRDTNCFNRKTFLQTIKTKKRNNEIYSFVAFGIKDYDFVCHSLTLKNLDRLPCHIAEFLNNRYGASAYCLSDSEFVVILDKNQRYEDVIRSVNHYFSQPIKLVNTEIRISLDSFYVKELDSTYDIDSVENGIRYVLQNIDDYTSSSGDFHAIINRLNRNHAIVHAINRAIENDSFQVYYQPIYNTHKRIFTSVEALIRLNDSDLGFISPEEFIPIAEQQGFICQIGETVFRKVCRFISESNCINKGVEYIEINLSPIQCFQEDIIEKFDEIMKEFNVKPEWINLEITETASFEEDNLMSENIHRFHDMGISFSIDDYGSGFASADYLFKLPVDIVKIDKSILWTAVKDANAMTVLESTVHMMKKLNKRIVVEGVENDHMVKLLTSMGCDYLQGYYYSKPIPETSYTAYISDYNHV